MPDRFVVDLPHHAANPGEPCVHHGSDRSISGRTVRRAALVGGLGAGVWLAMMALGQGHAQAAPAQPLPVGQHAVATTLGTVAKSVSAVTTGVAGNPARTIATTPIGHATAARTVTVKSVGSQPQAVVRVATATVGRVAHLATPLTTTVTPTAAPVTKVVTSVLTTATHVTAPIVTPITTVMAPVLTPIAAPVVPIVSPVVGPILGVTTPVTAPIVTTPVTKAGPTTVIPVTASAGTTTAAAVKGTATATTPATVAVPSAARADLASTERTSGRSIVGGKAPDRAHKAFVTPRRAWTVVSGAGGQPASPTPGIPAPEGALAGPATTGSAHSHDGGSALLARSARLAPPAFASTARPGSDRLPGDQIRSTDVSPD